MQLKVCKMYCSFVELDNIDNSKALLMKHSYSYYYNI